MQITTIGLDIAKNVFQVHGIDARARRSSFGSNFGAAKYWGSSRRCRVALWAWRPARHLTIGHVNSRSLATSAVDAGEGREGLRQAQ